MMHGRFSMKRVTLALATLLLALAVIPAADARVVQPPWVVVRWDLLGDCKIWRNDINGPWGPGWRPGGIRQRLSRGLRKDAGAHCPQVVPLAVIAARASTTVSPGSAGRNFL